MKRMAPQTVPNQATLIRLLREAVAWDQTISCYDPEEEQVIPEWRREAEALLEEVDRG